MPENPEITLFKSPLVHIIEHRCRGEDTRGSYEEAAPAHQISFPRYGVYQKRNRSGTFLVDPNAISFYEKGRPYQVRHPVLNRHPEHALCDISTIFEVQDEVLLPILEKTGFRRGDKPDFLNRAVKASPAIKAHQYFILHSIKLRRGGEQLAFEGAVLDFLFHVFAETSGEPKRHYVCCKTRPVRQAHEDLVEGVKLVVSRSFSEKLSLDSIARQVYQTPFSLARIFKHHTGLTIHKYVLRIRLLHGLERIMESRGDRIGQIGVDSGFSTPSHFSTAFFGEFKMSPSEFREQAGGRQVREYSNFLKA